MAMSRGKSSTTWCMCGIRMWMRSSQHLRVSRMLHSCQVVWLLAKFAKFSFEAQPRPLLDPGESKDFAAKRGHIRAKQELSQEKANRRIIQRNPNLIIIEYNWSMSSYCMTSGQNVLLYSTNLNLGGLHYIHMILHLCCEVSSTEIIKIQHWQLLVKPVCACRKGLMWT